MAKKITINVWSCLMVILVTVATGLLPVFVTSQPAEAASATTTITITKYDAHNKILATQTADYHWLENNLPIYGDGETHYWISKNFGNDADPWDMDRKSENEIDMGAVKGSDLADICETVGGMNPGDTVKLVAADNFKKTFDYETVYEPVYPMTRMLIAWYDGASGYVPKFEDGMRNVFMVGSDNPDVHDYLNSDGNPVYTNWDMHETLPKSRWSSSGLPSAAQNCVKWISAIEIHEPNLISCDASGNAKDGFTPGETIYVKGLGLAHNVDYGLWIQPEPVVAGDKLDAIKDPSGKQEMVTTDSNGDFAPVAIWNNVTAAGTGKYDIIADGKNQGIAGEFDSKDYIDNPGFEGFSIRGPVKADFKSALTSGTVPLTVHFTDTSTGIPDSWAWDFNNDGVTDSTDKNPIYTFNTPGTYTVTLKVSNADSQDQLTKTDYIEVTPPQPPAANFIADVTSGDAPLTVSFQVKSTGPPSGWAWDFNNDGITDSTEQNPVYTYQEAGTYTVKLTVTNSAGKDTATKTDYIVAAKPQMKLLWGPYLTKTSTTGTVINGRTTLPANVYIEYSDEAYFDNNHAYNQKVTETASGTFHSFTLASLKPDTVYHYHMVYACTDTGDYHFRTFPLTGKFSFVVVGDSQDDLPLISQYDRYKLIADRIAAEPDIAFMIHCGDEVNDGTSLDDWNRYFDVSRHLLANITAFPVLGNHEKNSALYYQAFGLASHYSFDCADVHFTMLDTNQTDLTEQTDWLKTDLASSCNWKFAVFHHPLYSSDTSHYGGWADLRAAWEQLFLDHGVNAVWNGHIHVYEHLLENGINYITAGTGGGPMGRLSADKYPGYLNSLESSLAYAKVTVDPQAETATVQIIRVADIAADDVTIVKVYPLNTVYDSFTIKNNSRQHYWDLNGDGVCNIGDGVTIGMHLGETGTPGWIPEDLNHDGVIDVKDIFALALIRG